MTRKSKGTTKPAGRRRDYRKEYERRIAKALAQGKSVSAGRGHPRAADLPKPFVSAIDRNSPLERALARMRKGLSQREAAWLEGVSEERLRRYRELNTASARHGRQWAIFDLRPVRVRTVTKGQMKEVTVTREDATEVAEYLNALNRFMWTNEAERLRPFWNRGVTDVHGTFHPFETRPNVLRKLDAIGELHFTEIYADVAK